MMSVPSFVAAFTQVLGDVTQDKVALTDINAVYSKCRHQRYVSSDKHRLNIVLSTRYTEAYSGFRAIISTRGRKAEELACKENGEN